MPGALPQTLKQNFLYRCYREILHTTSSGRGCACGGLFKQHLSVPQQLINRGEGASANLEQTIHFVAKDKFIQQNPIALIGHKPGGRCIDPGTGFRRTQLWRSNNKSKREKIFS